MAQGQNPELAERGRVNSPTSQTVQANHNRNSSAGYWPGHGDGNSQPFFAQAYVYGLGQNYHELFDDSNFIRNVDSSLPEEFYGAAESGLQHLPGDHEHLRSLNRYYSGRSNQPNGFAWELSSATADTQERESESYEPHGGQELEHSFSHQLLHNMTNPSSIERDRSGYAAQASGAPTCHPSDTSMHPAASIPYSLDTSGSSPNFESETARFPYQVGMEPPLFNQEDLFDDTCDVDSTSPVQEYGSFFYYTQPMEFPIVSLPQPADLESAGPVDQVNQFHTASPSERSTRRENAPAVTRPKKVSKRSGPLSEDKRKNAAQIRKIGRCIRCTIYKLGCDPGYPCGRCSAVAGTARLFPTICARVDLKNLQLARQGNGRFGQKVVNFIPYSWVDVHHAGASHMELKWMLPWHKPAEAPTLTVEYKEYVESVGANEVGSRSYVWSIGGSEKRIPLPPYAVADTSDLVKTIKEFIISNQRKFETQICQDLAQDGFSELIYKEARRYRSVISSDLIDHAFLVHCGAVISQGWGSVVKSYARGDCDCIDYTSIGASNYPAYNRKIDRPLPQAMGHQFDVAILLQTNEWAATFLKHMRQKMLQSKASRLPWYEIFLATFIVLSNVEYVYKGAKEYLESKRGTAIKSQVEEVVKEQIGEYERTTKTLLIVYRCMLKGYIPFKMARDNPINLQSLAEIDDKATEFLQQIAILAEKYKNESDRSNSTTSHEADKNALLNSAEGTQHEDEPSETDTEAQKSRLQGRKWMWELLEYSDT